MRYVAFLRAVNVGGRVARMDRLRRLFEEAGFSRVTTLLASGNVLFTGRRGATAGLERKIEQALVSALGFEVATFLRTPSEVAAVAAREVFPRVAASSAHGLYVGFLKEPLDGEQVRLVEGVCTPNDDLRVLGREIHWLCLERSPKSTSLPGRVEKALRVPATFRNVTTVRQVASLLAEET